MSGAPIVTLTGRGAARVRAGLPWVYADDVAGATVESADVVELRDGRGALLGTALFAAGAPLPVRVVARERVAFDAALIAARLEGAAALRRRLFPAADAYRLVHAEADGLPGLIVDRYGEVYVLQSTARALDAREPLIAALLARLFGARLVVARDDSSARDFESLPREKRLLLGSGATRVAYHDAGSRFEVDVLEDGKTGGFLDQRENHARAAEYARGEALDAFTYHGGFALALARGGATSVLALDESPAAVAQARVNARDNGLGQITVEEADAFDRLRRLEAEGRRFDTIVIDPPALKKRKGPPGAAERAYKELNLRALRLARPEAIVISCSCSGRLGLAAFGELIEEAAAAAGRTVQLLERRGAGRDHPPLVGLPETDYLKCWIMRVLA